MSKRSRLEARAGDQPLPSGSGFWHGMPGLFQRAVHARKQHECWK